MHDVARVAGVLRNNETSDAAVLFVNLDAAIDLEALLGRRCPDTDLIAVIEYLRVNAPGGVTKFNEKISRSFQFNLGILASRGINFNDRFWCCQFFSYCFFYCYFR